MEKKIPKKQTNKNLTSLKHQHVCINNRRVGAREGEVQVNHRRFGPDFLRTLGVLEISTTLLLPLPLLLFTLGWISLGNIITFFALFSFFALISLFLLDWWIETWIENISVRPFAPFFHVVFFFLLRGTNHLYSLDERFYSSECFSFFSLSLQQFSFIFLKLKTGRMRDIFTVDDDENCWGIVCLPIPFLLAGLFTPE